MPRLSNKKFEELFGALSRISQDPDASDRDAVLAEAFDTANAHLVERAARFVANQLAPGFETKIAALFHDFFDKPDPACVTKTALAEALDYLDYEDEQPFLRGVTWVQLAGPQHQEDTAINLRSRCLLAIARLDNEGAINHLADGLSDPQYQVRSAAAQAILLNGSPLGAPLLRFKLRTGDPEAEVLGEALKAYLGLDAALAIPFAQQALRSVDAPEREFAALALGEARPQQALPLLASYVEEASTERDLRVGLISLLMLRRDEATTIVQTLAKGKDPERADLAEELLEQFGYRWHDEPPRT